MCGELCCSQVALLRSRPPRVRKLTEKGDVGGLIRALTYRDPVKDREGRFLDLGVRTRLDAVEGLAELPGRQAVAGLSVALDDGELEVRRAAVAALREQGDVGEAALMRATTEWAHPDLADLRDDAIAALIAVGDEQTPRRCAAALLGRPAELTDADGAVLRELTDAWGPAARRDAIADLVAWLGDPPHALRARYLLVALAPDSVDSLVDALDDPAARVEAALALGATHDSRATEPLCHALLESEDAGTRAAAAWALGEVRDPAAVETLLIASGDDDYTARTAALDAFDKLGNAAVAVATSLLARPGIENGAATPPIRQVQPPPASSRRAGPVLRRLLGRSPDAR